MSVIPLTPASVYSPVTGNKMNSLNLSGLGESNTHPRKKNISGSPAKST